MVFGVQQKSSETINEVVSATLEMERYITKPTSHAGTATEESIAIGDAEPKPPATVAAANITEGLTTLVEKLTERVKELELKHAQEHGIGEIRKAFSYKGRSRGHGRGETVVGVRVIKGAKDQLTWSHGTVN